jgi:hypothetical protein
VVDLGCGDFVIGSELRQACGRYTACDIVPELIDFNKIRYKGLNVDFRVLDIVEDNLPRGKIVFLRQVLQHLSNDQICRILPKIRENFEVLIFSDHRPASNTFQPNRDIKAGVGTRLSLASGLDLSMPPFNLDYERAVLLCAIEDDGGLIVTTAFEFL